MRHTLPSIPAFRNQSPTDPIQEIALRVVAELPYWNLHVLGTATLIAGNLAITAKHVLDAAMRLGKVEADGVSVDGFALRLYQCLPLDTGPVYRIWNVLEAWPSETDIAILHLNLDRTSESEAKVVWRVPRLRILPPPTGHTVIACGYRESKIHVDEGPDGTHHIMLNDIETIAIGQVGQIFAERRDSSMLTFPCYEVHAKFAHGMSGGLVVDEEGSLCGLVCAGTTHADPSIPPLSYAATLWPMLMTVISVDRGDRYPRGVQYPMIDLARDNIINVVGLEELDPKVLSRMVR